MIFCNDSVRCADRRRDFAARFSAINAAPFAASNIAIRRAATRLVVVLSLLGLECFLLPTSASEDFVVGPGERYPTISAALADMDDGDACIVTEGVYRECLEVSHSNISILGRGRVIVTGCDVAADWQPARVNGRDGLTKSIDSPVYDVFCGNEYLLLARHPNKVAPLTGDPAPFQLSGQNFCGSVSAGNHILAYRSTAIGFRSLAEDSPC